MDSSSWERFLDWLHRREVTFFLLAAAAVVVVTFCLGF